MEFASNILRSILSKIGEYLVYSFIHRANYLLRFKNIVEELKREDGNLRSTRDGVQYEVERAKRNSEEIEKHVENWLTDVQNVLEEIQRLEDDMQMKKTFLCGLYPNWGWRYKLGRRAVKKMSEMAKLRESGKFDRLSHSTTLPGVQVRKDFISFKPTEYAFSQIMEALKNDKMNMVGLYGMGGVGKTTLAKAVGNKAKEKKLFAEVVMVTVTRNPDFKNIQGQIAESLDLKLHEEFIKRRAQRLRLRLKEEKKILIILDDVWRMLNLTTIGIPFGDDHKGCTILLTTRQQEVCKSMRCQPRIQLDTLNEDEALTLFKKHMAQLGQTTKENLRVLNMGISDQSCNAVLIQFRHGLQNLEELEISRCRVQMLFQLEDVEQELSLPCLKVLYLYWLQELECLCNGPTHLLSMPNLNKLSVTRCNRLRYMFSPSLARNFMQLEELNIRGCVELEEIFDEDDAEYNHLHSPLLFPNLSFIDIQNCDKLRSLFPVSITHLLSLQNLTTLQLYHCKRLTHLFSSTLARNLLQLESIFIQNCKELEKLIVEDVHVQLGLFPNLSSISVKKCGKLKTLFPAVTIARSGLQKLRTLNVESSSQLEVLFGHKDEADMTSDREMVLPRLEELTLEQLASLVNFCPVGYHFKFPSLSRLLVTKCPKITTRFSVDQNRSVHAEGKEPQMGKEDGDMKQSRRKTTVEIDCWGFYGVESILPPYIRKQ
ncbi:hypothetical protein Dsin_022387 [Dipteronia sinensis]|uniref:AAA+ ATPase domain-containing protein n=1 Tax=Dipteronia sinensis TaxID=43782 RepID=A0AAE0E137_9ROSI|nr:hypothetical protein Dsin_022387 [Dipteronia sinensis]